METALGDPRIFGYPLMFAAGLIAGALNVVAGGGSFITLPIMIFLGLPAGVANGTNRVGILLQNVAAVTAFKRYGFFDRSALLWAGLPATTGAALGAWLALAVGDRAFQQILAALMVVVALGSLWSPPSKTDEAPPATGLKQGEGAADRKVPYPVLVAGFFAVGIYGGFVQAGVGFLLLAMTTMAGLDLVRGNAVKVLTVLCLTVLAFLVFASQGRVHWPLGLTMAGGTILGGILGTRLTVLKGHRWIRRVVTLTLIVFAVKLWFSM